MSNPTDQQEVVLRAPASSLRFEWEIFSKYRETLFLFVWRDFVSKYKQTLLGPAWFLFQPLLTTAVFSVIFGSIVGVSTNGVPKPLFYFCGLLPWGYHSQNFNGISHFFHSNNHLFSRVYFPRLIVPVSILISNLFAFLLQALFFVVMMAYFFSKGLFQAPSGAALIMIVPALLQAAMTGLGAGLWFAALSVKYRDIQVISGFILQIWLYTTPIIYPLSATPEKWRWFFVLNPMTGAVELFRHAFFMTPLPETRYLAASFAVAAAAALFGLWQYNRIEPVFVDYV